MIRNDRIGSSCLVRIFESVRDFPGASSITLEQAGCFIDTLAKTSVGNALNWRPAQRPH